MTGSEGRGRSGKRPSLRGGRDDRGRGDAGAGSGPLALSLWGGERGWRGAAQAQGLRPFAMWLAPHIHTEKYRPENPQAASRPVFFGMTARLVEKLKNPLTTGGRSDNV